MGSILLALPDGASGDQLRSLRDWLGREGELRGRIELVESEPVAGTLGGGGILKALSVAVGSGGAITALVSGIVSWLRQLAGQRRQPMPTEVTLEFAGGASIKIVADMVQGWTPAELGDQIDRLAGLVSPRALASAGDAEADGPDADPDAADAGPDAGPDAGDAG